MKYSKKIRGMSTALAFAFVFMVFSFSFAPKALAVEFNGNIYYGVREQKNGAYNRSFQTTGELPIINGAYSVVSSNSSFSEPPYLFSATFATDAVTEFKSNVKLYASFYFKDVGRASLTSDYLDNDSWIVSYVNTNAQTGYVEGGLDAISTFTPDDSGVFLNQGWAIEASWQGFEALPIRALNVYQKLGSGVSVTSGYYATIRCPSIRMITTEYTAEMESLDKIADEIAAQSDILLAMKGDLVAILQDIYTMTGDMYIAQNLLNGYVEQMLPLLQQINANTINIYSLLSSQLAALETAINTSASTIEAAIEAQTAAMIAYLEEMFNTNNEVPSETYEQQQDAENILDQMESLEKPDVETIVPEIDDYSDGGVSGVMSAIFSSNLIVTMMTLSASLAFGAYVLFGKRS